MIRPFNFRKKRAYGVATIANGDTSVNVAHGLGQTPSIVLLTGTHDEVSGVTYTANATTITITAPAATTGDRDVSWYAEC